MNLKFILPCFMNSICIWKRTNSRFHVRNKDEELMYGHASPLSAFIPISLSASPLQFEALPITHLSHLLIHPSLIEGLINATLCAGLGVLRIRIKIRVC